MEPAAAWGPCQFQLANWTVQEPACQAWCPAAGGLPMEYGSIIDIFGTTCCSHLPAYVPESSGGGQQLAEYNYSPAMENSVKQVVVDPQNVETRNCVNDDSCARNVFKQVERAYKVDIDLMEEKMHRYPAGLGDSIDKDYTVPRIVAIGRYNHHLDHLKQAEKVKHMAAIRCVRESGKPLEVVYSAVASAADDALGLYDKDVMKGISFVDFRHMMFFDACFLVQYMRLRSPEKIDDSLSGFFIPNRRDIRHDVKLLENQLPWKVVQTVMRFRSVSLRRFISIFKGYEQDQKLPKEDVGAVLTLDESYRPPHLLALLRYYSVGRSRCDVETNYPTKKTKTKSDSISAMELAKIGIMLRPNYKTRELIHMNLSQEGTFFAKLSMAPLSLDSNRASYLVNMAAFEMCTARSFSKAKLEDSAACGYLLLLAMLVYREEDVQELRARGLLQGGGGLTNTETLRLFNSLQGLSYGTCYTRIMRQIDSYKENRRVQAKLHEFYYRNKKPSPRFSAYLLHFSGS